ncbi:unnamed protein product [Linum trigynum]
MSAVLADELAPAAAPSLDVVAGGPAAGGPAAGGPAAGPAAEAAAKSAAVVGSVPFVAVSLMSTLVAYLLP